MITLCGDDGSARTEGIEDAAWVVIDTTWAPDALRRFIDDVPRLLRINPLLVFSGLEVHSDNRLQFTAHNLSNDLSLDVGIDVRRTNESITLIYDEGLKASTRIDILPDRVGTKLRITDDYSRLDPAERRARAGEVDLSLHAWGVELRRYLAQWKRWSWLPPWRFYMERFWLRMSPSARRIARLIWVISALELAAFVAIVVIWQVA